MSRTDEQDRLRGQPDERLLGLSPTVIAAGIFLLALLARGTYWLLSGTVSRPSRIWLRFCEPSVANYMGWLGSSEAAELVLYSGYWVPFCTVTGITGGSFDAMVGFQILLSALACVVIFDVGRRHVNLLAGTTAGLALAVLMDGFVWTTRMLGDSTLVFVVSVTLWMIGRYRLDPTRRNRILVWLCLGYLSVTRPYGFPIAAGWVLYDLLPTDSEYRVELFPYRRIAIGLLVLTVPIVSFLLINRWGVIMIDFWSRGVLVADDPSFPRYPFELSQASSLPVFVLRNVHHIVLMAVVKVGIFFLPFVPRFSTLHNVVNVFTFVPIYTLGFVGLGRLYRNNRYLFRLWIVPLVGTVGIVALTFMDYSWGYRAPTGPVFALLTGYTLGTDPRVAALKTRLESSVAERYPGVS